MSHARTLSVTTFLGGALMLLAATAPNLARQPWQGAPQGPTLAGARPVIDAANYPSLQQAFDALPEDGGMVRIPPGRFEIDAPLRISRSDVMIAGAGTATWIVNKAADGRPALVLAPPADASNRAYLWRMTVRDLRITGNEASGHGLVARRINELLLDAVHISHNGGDGIRLDHCYEDPRVCDSLITYNKAVGLNVLGCHDIVVSANQFEENRDAVRCVDAFNLTMTGNNIDDHLGDGVIIENTYGSVLAGNMIEECQGRGIVLDRDCYGIAISANVIAHNVAGGVDLRDAWGMTVSANAFTIMAADALRIGPGSGRIAVTGNSFANSYIGDGAVKRRADDLAAAGVVLDGSSEVTFSGNLFAGLRPAGLQADGARRIVFDGNLMVDANRTVDPPGAWTEGNLDVDK